MKLSHSEILEYRRIKYNQEKRELTQQEKDRLSFFKATYTLNPLEQMGYDFEIKEVLPRIIEAGFLPNIIYHNPVDPFEWRHTRTKGVDMIMKIGDYILCIEMTCLGARYSFRRDWFIESRIPRFEGCPKPSKYVQWIVLTNRPENFNSVKSLANEYSITIMSIEDILSLISKLTVTNNQLTN